MPRSELRAGAAGLLTAAALLGVVLLPPAPRGVLELLVVGAACVVCVPAVRAAEPPVRDYWRLVSLAIVGQAGASILHALRHLGVPMGADLVLGVRLAALLLIAVLLMLTALAAVGPEDLRWGLDIVVWAGGVASLLAVLLLPPEQAAGLLRTALSIVLVALPLLCVVLLGLLLLPAHRHTPAWRWGVRVATAALVAGALTAGSPRPGAHVPPVGEWLTLMGFVALAASAVVAGRSTAVGRPLPRLPGVDLVFLGVVAVAMPVSLLAGPNPDLSTALAATWGLVALLRLAVVLLREREHARTLARLAGTDTATGLGNLGHLSRRADELLGARQARDRHVALILIQVHRFPEISRTLGVTLGIEYLRLVADALRLQLGPSRSLSSTAVGQFGVLGWASDEGDARGMALGLRRELRGSVPLGALPMPVECHIGVALAPVGTTTSERLLRQAEIALESAAGAPDQVAVYSRAGHGSTSLLSELPGAIRAGQLDVALQPTVSLGGGGVVGFEALVRWQHPTTGLLMPGSFVPGAEDTGLIWLITEHVLDAALRHCARWRAAGSSATVAVNLSAGDLERDGLADHVARLLHGHGLPPAALELEITETVALGSGERTRQSLHSLAALGVGLAIDDFGTGYSSLRHLQQLPFTQLKIDRSFVAQVCADPTSAALVTSTIQMAHALDLQVVGEGVEDFETLLFLRDVGCDVAQGYVIGRPAAPDQLTSTLSRVERAVLPRLRAVQS